MRTGMTGIDGSAAAEADAATGEERERERVDGWIERAGEGAFCVQRAPRK
jgi:hypothetical protein